jgi:hypothetical protein
VNFSPIAFALKERHFDRRLQVGNLVAATEGLGWGRRGIVATVDITTDGHDVSVFWFDTEKTEPLPQDMHMRVWRIRPATLNELYEWREADAEWMTAEELRRHPVPGILNWPPYYQNW